LAARLDALFKLGIVASLLLASAGVGYYYAVYLPRRDAELDNQRTLEKAQADAQKRAARERSLVEQKQSERRQAAAKAGAEDRYQTCLKSASVTHDASWAAECKHLAAKALADHADCLAKSKLSHGYCDAAYRTRDASPNCTLPVRIATSLDGDLTIARNHCLRERKAASQ
jgi:hypothetical protein